MGEIWVLLHTRVKALSYLLCKMGRVISQLVAVKQLGSTLRLQRTLIEAGFSL